MKKLQKFMSYVLVATLASMLTLALYPGDTAEPSKLTLLETLIEEKFIGESDRTALEDAAATAMINSLGDQWSYYIPADEYADYLDRMANSYVGIGITIQKTEGVPGFLVTKVNPGGPADQAGMLPGDILVGVDGADVREMSIDDTGSLVKGEENSTVDITVDREGQELTLTVTRMLVETPVATARMLTDGVGLITITNFDERCADETNAAMEELLA